MDRLLKLMSTMMTETQKSDSAGEGAADRDSPRGVSPGSAQGGRGWRAGRVFRQARPNSSEKTQQQQCCWKLAAPRRAGFGNSASCGGWSSGGSTCNRWSSTTHRRLLRCRESEHPKVDVPPFWENQALILRALISRGHETCATWLAASA